jgi:hypothetical protein
METFAYFIGTSDEPATAIFRSALEHVYDRGDRTEHIERLSPEARLVYLTYVLEGEVTNGGIDQFFTNSSGNHALETLDCLKAIKALRYFDILQAAMNWFPDGNPSADRMERWEQYQNFSEDPEYLRQMNDLDIRYYDRGDELSKIVDNYIRQHPAAHIVNS